jgi:lipopolysaccharide transport system ATP-binding protein
MSNIGIRVQNLSKLYKIGVRRYRHYDLRDQLADGLKGLFGRNRRSQPGIGTIWALKEISFDVEHGEVVGIIGGNGAGKSTLLKILSRITEPTEGQAEIHGRVGSLLEVGTGFHPELTGRDNIYLSGAILGMRKREIESKFDEIVAFSEIEKFIDTPVKRYSSGMFVRLAFAVAAHLEPEILIVDEVLAVGDARFQKKCLNKMHDVGQGGRTVLFVSHSMPAITRLCQRAILLKEGRLIKEGSSHQIVSSYLNSGFGTAAVREWPDRSKAPGSEVARLRAVRVRNERGEASDVIDIKARLSLEMEFEVFRAGHLLLPNFNLYSGEGIQVFTTFDLDPKWRGRSRPAGHYISRALIPGNLLAEGTFFVEPALMTLEPFIPHFRERDSIAFQVIDSHDGNSARGDWTGDMGGLVRPLLRWTTQLNPFRDASRIKNEKVH